MTDIFFDVFRFDVDVLLLPTARYEWDSDTVVIFVGETYALCDSEQEFEQVVCDMLQHEFLHSELRKAVGRDFFRQRNVEAQCQLMIAEERVVHSLQCITWDVALEGYYLKGFRQYFAPA
jgi:hypothetical protein